MLYKIVRWLARLTINFYFRKVFISGKENIPDQGPVIFVANHPSAFMDPMVVAFSITRTLHFLAAAEFFGTGFKAWFYQNQLNMVPVYRPTTLPNESYKNDEVFAKCIALLAEGKSILIFPEGNSVTEKRIRKLKTGVARMALGTRQVAQHGQVQIVPVGLNYTNPHRFQSDLLINIGSPISIESFAVDKEGVNALTEEVERKLKETVHHIPNEDLDPIIKKVDIIFKRKFSFSSTEKKDEFVFQQKVIEAIRSKKAQEPKAISNLESKLDVYLGKIKQLGISDAAISDLSILVSLGELALLMLTLPIFLFGFIVNCIPYYGTIYYFRSLRLFSREGVPSKQNVRAAFFGSIGMSIGAVMFLLYYIALSVTVGILTNTFWIALVLWIPFYSSGLFAMQYIRWFYSLNQKRKLRGLISKQRDVFASLIVERQEIIREIKATVI